MEIILSVLLYSLLIVQRKSLFRNAGAVLSVRFSNNGSMMAGEEMISLVRKVHHDHGIVNSTLCPEPITINFAVQRFYRWCTYEGGGVAYPEHSPPDPIGNGWASINGKLCL